MHGVPCIIHPSSQHVLINNKLIAQKAIKYEDWAMFLFCSYTTSNSFWTLLCASFIECAHSFFKILCTSPRRSHSVVNNEESDCRHSLWLPCTWPHHVFVLFGLVAVVTTPLIASKPNCRELLLLGAVYLLVLILFTYHTKPKKLLPPFFFFIRFRQKFFTSQKISANLLS
jgi:hypothetical protein